MYQVSPMTDGVIIGTTGVLSILPYVVTSNIVNIRSTVNPQELIPLDRGVIGNRNTFLDSLSNVTLGLAMVAPPVLDLIDLGWSREYREDMIVYAEVLSINGALVTLFKYTVQRPLPRIYAGTDPDIANNRGSFLAFYSGHTSFTFAALASASVTLGLRYDAGVLPWLVTVAVGTTVAGAMVAAGQHFYTDVFVGAIMGTAVGALVPWLHRREKEGASHFSLAPAPTGAALTWKGYF